MESRQLFLERCLLAVTRCKPQKVIQSRTGFAVHVSEVCKQSRAHEDPRRKYQVLEIVRPARYVCQQKAPGSRNDFPASVAVDQSSVVMNIWPRPARSLFRSTLLCSLSILKGPPFMRTWMEYSSAGSEGTRHEYRQVKPHPYSNSPSATTSSPAEIVNFGFPGRLPLTRMSEQISWALPTSDMPSEIWLAPWRYWTSTLGR